MPFNPSHLSVGPHTYGTHWVAVQGSTVNVNTLHLGIFYYFCSQVSEWCITHFTCISFTKTLLLEKCLWKWSLWEKSSSRSIFTNTVSLLIHISIKWWIKVHSDFVSASYLLIPNFRNSNWFGVMKDYKNVAQTVGTHSHFIIKIYILQEITPNKGDTSRNISF